MDSLVLCRKILIHLRHPGPLLLLPCLGVEVGYLGPGVLERQASELPLYLLL